MTERKTSDQRLSEQDVDRLLQRFFVEEVPAEFQQREVPVTPARPQIESLVRSTTPDSSRSLAGMLALLVSATCCLMVILFIPGEPARESGPAPVPAIGSHEEPAAGNDDSVPVEERPHLPFTSNSNSETIPNSESESTDPIGPELEIEIYPLRPDKPAE